MDASRLRQLAISDSGFVFDPTTGHTFTVNPSGALVIAALKEGHGQDEVVRRLQGAFELDGTEDLSREVEDFMARLAENGLLG
ncbi:MAG: HPr-rel-A system PqqD family peptide chaperone [Polyangiaceae bacterium]|nr:HPr-rel-A system PqqD family peptide chaperone [Polyangiaceae bacterium]